MIVNKVIDTSGNTNFEWDDFFDEETNYPLFGWGPVEKVVLREWQVETFYWDEE